MTNNLNNVINKGTSLVIGNGIETKLKIDSLGSEWSNNIFYYNSHHTSDQLFSTTFYTPLIPVIGGDGKADNKRDLFSAKSDLKLKLKKKFTFETGAKTTFHIYKNITNYFRETGGIRTKDIGRTNTFQLQ